MVKPSGRGSKSGEVGEASLAGAGADGPRAQRIQAVDRAVELLKAVAGADRPATAAELAQACGMNRTTAWRLLSTLEDHGLVERDADQRYAIGYGTVALAQSPSGSGALVRIARPALEQLFDDTGETVTLSVLRNGGVVTIDQIDPPDATWVLNYLTKPLPLNATSNGKIVLASLTRDALERYLAAPLPAPTPYTVTDPGRLREIVAQVRQDGYAVSVSELDVGINGVSVGVADENGALLAMLSVSGTDHRLPAERLAAAVPAMQRAAEAIGVRIM